jgi:hypothetical protein
MSAPKPADTQPDLFAPIPRHLYIGAVSLLVRLHRLMPAEERRRFDGDGDPMARLAADFNKQPFTLEMRENGDAWLLVGRAAAHSEPPPDEACECGKPARTEESVTVFCCGARKEPNERLS